MKKLPTNWVNVHLQDVTINVKGKKPKIQSEVEFEGSIPYMDIKALEYNVIRQFADIESSKHFEEGDVAMVWDGARSGWVSKTNFGAIGSTLVAFKPIKINSNYLFYYLLEKYPFINSNARGVGIPHVDPTVLWSLEFPLPPLPEQNRIVTKLDALFAQLEIIKTSLANIPLLLKDFRQQVLTQAVTGKLTEDFRKKQNWEYKKIEKITLKVGSGSTPTGGQAAYLDEGIPLIRSMNVHFNGIKYDGLAYLNEDQAKGLKNVEVFENDILLNITGASIGRVCLAPKEISGARVNQHVCIIRVNNELKPSFLNIYLSSPIIQNIINNENYGVTRQSFTKAQILELEIPIPSIEEQEIILSKVESILAKTDAIEQQYKALKEKTDNLPQSMLHKAFKGELTKQLDTDGDAKELLKAIADLKNIKVTKPKTYKVSKEKLRLVAEPK